MADDSTIGSLNVEIEADASPLQSQLDEAVSESESAATRIADAFESLVGIGESLAITEGLKEFGQEALDVYGTVQSVTIGLTQLTGSATQAAEIIGQVKELANTEPFAFPELAPTVQKMVALGVSAEDIPRVMQAAADTSAATGNSFDAVAASIDRMALSGNAGARQLTQLGLSTQSLATVMGVSAAEVKKAFTDMDQSERLDVLTQALDKFAGAAEAQAQGIAGQWQIFQNKFEEVMSGVGEALTPAISDILKFGDDALHVAQELIDGFNQLPEPVKEIAGAFAIAVAAIAPLTLAVGVLGQGLIGIQAVVGSVNGLLQALGITSGEAAAAQTTEAAATTAQGTAATVTAGELEALAVAEGSVGEAAAASATATETATFGFGALDTAVQGAGAAIAGLIVYNVAKWADDNVPAIHQMADSIYDLGQKALDAAVGQKGFSEALTLWVTGALKPGAQAADQLSQSTFLLSQKLGELGIVIPRGTQTMEQWNAALLAAAANHQKVLDSANNLGGGLDALVAKQEKLNAAEQQAAADLLIAQTAYKEHKITLDSLDAAYDAYDKALAAATPKSENFKDTVAGLSIEFQKQQGAISTLQASVMQLIAAQDGSIAKAEALSLAEQKLDAAYATLDKDAKTLNVSIQGTGENFSYMGEQAEALVQKQRDLTLAVQEAKAIVDQLTASSDTSVEHSKAVIQALTNWQAAIKATGGDLNQLNTIVVNGVLFSGKLPDIIKEASDQLKEFGGTTVTVSQEFNELGVYAGVISDTMKDNITVIKGSDDALKQYHGTIVTGQPIIKGYIDDTTKAIGYNQQFTGSVNDLGAAIGNTLNPSLNAANSALSNLPLEVEQADQQLQQMTQTAIQAAGALDQVDQALKALDSGGTMGSTDATALGQWALQAGMTGLTTFAGSGSARNSQGQMVSALDELQAAEQAAGNALAATTKATTTATTATTTHTSAITASTAATTAATTQVNNAATAVSNLSTVAQGTAAGVSQAVASISQSAQSLGISLGGGATTASTGGGFSTTPIGTAQGTGSGLATLVIGSTAPVAGSLGTGSGLSGGVNPYDYFSNPNNLFNSQNAGGSLFTPQNQPNAAPIQINMNYPQFNSQQQSSKVMNDVVTMMRNVAGQKL